MSGLKHKAFCVHGHFYQPPRENPWTGRIAPEESASPHPNWNSRISAECYEANAAVPVPGADGRPAWLQDNFRRISFNFGPTLLRWLERQRPALYKAILQADRDSLRRLGHGNAFAQPYVHAILPLLSERNRLTLMRWGLRDFESRFGRASEGLWLPETAVDDATLEAAASEGVRFVVLGSHQAAAVRSPGGPWTDVEEKDLDPTRPYRWKGSKGRQLAVFFYHGLLSRGVETGESVSDGLALAAKVLARYKPDDSHELVHMASDGEFYGHHIKGAHEALALALRRLEAEGVSILNYGAFLDKFPPPQEARVRQNTSWSCPHGIGRWTEDCGCRSARNPAWRQDWRGPLRDAMEWLGEELDGLYEDRAGAWLRDPWEARDAFWAVLRDPEAAGSFLKEQAPRKLDAESSAAALRLLDMQRQRLEMLTSCGWFADEVSGLEATQVLQRSARAISLAKSFGVDPTEGFLKRLASARSNIKTLGDGAAVYRRLALTGAVEPARAVSHQAILEHLGLTEAAPPCPVAPAKRASWLRLERRGQSLSMGRLEPAGAPAVSVVIHQTDPLDVACWHPAEAEGLEERFERLDPRAMRAELVGRFGGGFRTLESLLSVERRDALRLLVPEPGAPAGRKEFLAAWTGAAAEARAGRSDRLLDLLEEAPRRKLAAVQLPWLDAARTAAWTALEALVTSDSEAQTARAMRWIAAFAGAGNPMPRTSLLFLYKRWSKALAARRAPEGAAQAVRAFGESLGLSEALLSDREGTW